MKKFLAAFVLGLAVASPTFAHVTITDPWVLATVPQQMATGAFLAITSSQDAKLIEARSTIANTVELHKMAMTGNIMKMRPVSHIDLPAGKTVKLEPKAYHIMLLSLKGQVKVGEMVPLTLIVENKYGKRESVVVKAVARSPSGAMSSDPHHQ